MFYMVWFSGDCPDSFSWFEVHPKKRLAMAAATRLVESVEAFKHHGVKYVGTDPNWQFHHSAANTIAVVQTDWYYYGA